MESVVTITRENADPADWRAHRFGLSPARWSALEGRTFWVTGAGTGFGRAVAIGLRAAGARVFSTGRRAAMLDATSRAMTELGLSEEAHHPIPCDLTSPDDIRAACRSIADRAGSLDGVVHAAALPAHPPFPLLDSPPEVWDRLMATNVRAPWLATREAIPLLRKGAGVRAVFFSSEAGWAGTAGVGTYNVSKAALNGLAHSLAAECAARFPDDDVQINVVVPGQARTEMNQGSPDSPFTVVSMVLLLLSAPRGGPNGRFFHRDGRHLSFGSTPAYARALT